ncbi:uncharacterized protein BT62DRAFT_194271 [Guyanagaster necrorhizus]|uniref:Uncharacterized protein n=1 Tax=Guyanagaster necrorhizus TaxID=856835 RepID=A0A9P7VQ95_9AGAR|nr:uncharacterized protein BT62DRAFT_194271 [Guyanagaster necrorhizus MCA 3950]KAG7445426.1 hypothetical protein BT62DRAFT_194271 [Guyanagaster necrorhizus MCA 3950]
MGPKPEKGPHTSWHAHENCLGVEWEDICCSRQQFAGLLNEENCRDFIYPLSLAPGEAPFQRRARNGANGVVSNLSSRKSARHSDLGKLDQYTCIIAHLTDPSSDKVEIPFTVVISNIHTQVLNPIPRFSCPSHYICLRNARIVRPPSCPISTRWSTPPKNCVLLSTLTPMIFLGRNPGLLIHHFPTAHGEK